MLLSARLRWLLLALALPCVGLAQSGGSSTTLIRLNTGGHIGPVSALAFLPDGRLASGSRDKTVRLWNLSEGSSEVRRFPIGPGDLGKVYSLSAGGGLLAAGIQGTEGKTDARVVLFSADGGAKPIDGFTGFASVALSPDGLRVAVLDATNSVSVFDTRTLGKSSTGALPLLKTAIPQVARLQFSADGSMLAYGEAALDPAFNKEISEIGILDATKLKTVKRRNLKTPFESLAWTRDGIVAGTDGALGFLMENGSAKDVPLADGERIVDLKSNVDGRLYLAVQGKHESHFEVRDSGGALSSRSQKGIPEPATTIAVTADGSKIALGMATGDIHVGDGTSSDVVLKGSGAPIGAIGWGKDSQTVFWSYGIEDKDRIDPSKAAYAGAFDLAQLKLGQVPAATDRTFLRAPVGCAVKLDEKSVSLNFPGGNASIPRIDPSYTINNAAIIDPTHIVLATDKGTSVQTLGSPAKPPMLEMEGNALGIALSPDGRYFAIAGDDQVIRIWPVNDSRFNQAGAVVPALLSLYPGSNDDWIVWNEDKVIYATSTQGDDVLGLVTSEGDKATFEKAYARHEEFEKPDDIKAIFAKASLEGAGLKSAQSMPEAAASGPKISIGEISGAQQIAPDGLHWVANRADVMISLRADRPNVKVKMDQSNKPKSLRSKPGSSPLDFPVHLYDGDNLVRFTADGGATLDVHVALSGAPLEPAALHVLAIGVSDYDNKDIPSLPSKNDVDAIKSFFESANTKLKPGDRLKSIDVDTAIASVDTSKAGIWKKIDEFKKRVQPGDLALIYVSSHGAVDDATHDFFMIPRDTDPNNLEGTAIRWQDLFASLTSEKDGIDCRALAIVIDACNSGGSTQFNLGENDADSRTAATRSVKDTSMILVTSSLENEPSQLLSDQKESAFTDVFLDALAGKMRLAAKYGFVWLDRMQDSLRDALENLVADKKAPHLQRPLVTNPRLLSFPVAPAQEAQQ